MTSENTGITIKDSPATFKLFVRQHFGYSAEMINGSRVTDKLSVVSDILGLALFALCIDRVEL